MPRPATTTGPLTFEMLMPLDEVYKPSADEPVFIGRSLRAKFVVYELEHIRLYENFYDKNKHEFTVKRFNLTQLTLDRCIIDESAMRAVTTMLSKHPSITGLSITNCKVTPEAIQELASALAKNNTLTEIALTGSLNGNPRAMLRKKDEFPVGTLKEEDRLIPLFTTLLKLKSLKQLILADNWLTDLTAIVIAHFLKSNTTLEALVLSGNKISDAGIIGLFETLSVNKTLKHLDISKTLFAKLSVDAIAYALGGNIALERLSLRSNCLDDDDIEKLALTLFANTNLKFFDLGENSFDDKGARKFASVLMKNTTLENLILDHCWIDYSGAYRLAITLNDNNNTLKNVDLRWNHISANGVKQLAPLLANNLTLSSFNINVPTTDEVGFETQDPEVFNEEIENLMLRNQRFACVMSAFKTLSCLYTEPGSIDKRQVTLDEARSMLDRQSLTEEQAELLDKLILALLAFELSDPPYTLTLSNNVLTCLEPLLKAINVTWETIVRSNNDSFLLVLFQWASEKRAAVLGEPVIERVIYSGFGLFSGESKSQAATTVASPQVEIAKRSPV